MSGLRRHFNTCLSSEEENASETKLIANEQEEKQESAEPWNPWEARFSRRQETGQKDVIQCRLEIHADLDKLCKGFSDKR